MSRAPLMGHAYTMSMLKHPCGDRSFMHDVWEVLESNGTHVVIRNASPRYESAFGVQPVVVAVHEFDWTPADELLAVLRATRPAPELELSPTGEPS